MAFELHNQEEESNILNALGVAYRNLYRLDDALSSFQQALEIRKSIADEDGTEGTLRNIAEVQEMTGNSKAALSNYQEAIDVAIRIGDKHGLALSWMNLGSFYLDHGNSDEALRFTRQALRIYREIDDKANQAHALNNIGIAFANKGEYQEALTQFEQAYQISRQLHLLDDANDALREMGEINFKLGQYETAKSQLLKALNASKAAGDIVTAALDSSTLGVLFADQGEYDKALEALDYAVKGLQQVNYRTLDSVETMARYGDVLSMVGRGVEGQKYIDNALTLAVQVKGSITDAEVLNTLGDSYFYRGDYSSASQQYQRALQTASKTMTDQRLRAQLGLARLDLEQGHSQAAVLALKEVLQDANSIGLKAISARASIIYAQALLATNQADAGRQQLEEALGQAARLGMRVELARAQYLMGKTLTATGKPKEAALHYQEAARILQSLSTLPGANHLLERPDLKTIFNDAKSRSGGFP